MGTRFPGEVLRRPNNRGPERPASGAGLDSEFQSPICWRNLSSGPAAATTTRTTTAAAFVAVVAATATAAEASTATAATTAAAEATATATATEATATATSARTPLFGLVDAKRTATHLKSLSVP